MPTRFGARSSRGRSRSWSADATAGRHLCAAAAAAGRRAGVNFDHRSFQLHDEVTLCVWDQRFAGKLHEAFERDLERAQELEQGRWERRGVFRRAAEAATTVLRREL
ncbi:MAG: hypothetical protein ACRDLO_11555 [Solirubrobacterales bacterium]